MSGEWWLVTREGDDNHGARAADLVWDDLCRVVKSFHKKIREDKTKLNWLPMRSTGL